MSNDLKSSLVRCCAGKYSKCISAQPWYSTGLDFRLLFARTEAYRKWCIGATKPLHDNTMYLAVVLPWGLRPTTCYLYRSQAAEVVQRFLLTEWDLFVKAVKTWKPTKFKFDYSNIIKRRRAKQTAWHFDECVHLKNEWFVIAKTFNQQK